jgi:hypothetical protein
MSRDLLNRPPLRASELPPGRVTLYRGEARAVVCPECGRWQVPHDGGIRRHTVSADAVGECSGAGRRVWFDLSPADWLISLHAATRETAARRRPRTRPRRRLRWPSTPSG